MAKNISYHGKDNDTGVSDSKSSTKNWKNNQLADYGEQAVHHHEIAEIRHFHIVLDIIKHQLHNIVARFNKSLDGQGENKA